MKIIATIQGEFTIRKDEEMFKVYDRTNYYGWFRSKMQAMKYISSILDVTKKHKVHNYLQCQTLK